MPRKAEQSGADRLADPRVTAAIDQLVELLSLRAAGRSALIRHLRELVDPWPKLPHVSFYAATTRGGRTNYRITYRVPGHPRRTERLGKLPGPAYKRAQRVSDLLQQVAARLMHADDAWRMLYADNRSIEVHLEDFERHLAAKGNDSGYIRATMTRLRRCCELGHYTRLRDITRPSLPRLIEALRGWVDPRNGRALTASTINQYLAALRQFTKWAHPERMPVDPLAGTKGVKNTTEKKRRDVQPGELAAIVAAARASGSRGGMSGEDRAMLYLTAFGTGLRRKELRHVQLSWLGLDEDPPVIRVPGRHTKNGKDAIQPLPTWLAGRMRGWLGDRRAGRLFPSVPRDTAAMFDEDREAARQAWLDEAADPQERRRREESEFLRAETAAGELVFHSLRHAYATQLVASGLDLKSAQVLTRHGSVKMLERYTHARLVEAARGVERGIEDPLTQEDRR